MNRRATQDIRKKVTSIKKAALLLTLLLTVIGLNISTGIIQDIQYIMTMDGKYTFT